MNDDDQRGLASRNGVHTPVNGVFLYDSRLYVSEGGCPARISRWNLHDSREVILDNLPGDGNCHTNMAGFGRDDPRYQSVCGPLTTFLLANYHGSKKQE
jgi:hypothetical protein